jgi:hypothetical protein
MSPKYNLQKMVVFGFFFLEEICKNNKASISMFVCTTVLYEYPKLLRNDVNNLLCNAHVRIEIYYHCIIYIVNEGRHAKIKK